MNKKQYVITNGHKYIKQDANGKYQLTTNIAIADNWSNKKTAESILRNSVPQGMRYSLYVAELKDGMLIGQETLSEKQIVDCRERVSVSEDKTYELSKYSFDDDKAVQDMIKGFKEVQEVLSKYGSTYEHQKLEDKTMAMNWIVEDIKHYHGKKALNARDGFKLNKLEDKAIIKRISVKNQLEISRALGKYRSIIFDAINEICSIIEDVKGQKYKPRMLFDLFENDNLDIEF